MKKAILFVAVAMCAMGAFAQPVTELNTVHVAHPQGWAGGGGGGSQLVNHGGPVIVAPKVVNIFWGFGTGDS